MKEEREREVSIFDFLFSIVLYFFRATRPILRNHVQSHQRCQKHDAEERQPTDERRRYHEETDKDEPRPVQLIKLQDGQPA